MGIFINLRRDQSHDLAQRPKMQLLLKLSIIMALSVVAKGCQCCEEQKEKAALYELWEGALNIPEETKVRIPHRGKAPSAIWSSFPKFTNITSLGVKCLADGILEEWKNAAWLEKAVKDATGVSGSRDLSARLGFGNDQRGVCIALVVFDDQNQIANHQGAFSKSDHVMIEFWPTEKKNSLYPLGIKFRVGTSRKLVEFIAPNEDWRQNAVSSAGVTYDYGYRLEVRIPIAALTPLISFKVTNLNYRVTLFDADKDDVIARETLRFEGSLKLFPALEVPEPVQERISLRLCLASEPNALIGYYNGWRCSIPYGSEKIIEDDKGSFIEMGHVFFPEPPRLGLIKEKIVFINIPGVGHSVVGLVDNKKRILSFLPLGIVGQSDPGNELAKESEAQPLRLPDGSWGVSVVHAYKSKNLFDGARCSLSHKVYASIIAARGVRELYSEENEKKSHTRPYLEEIFRTLLESCSDAESYTWTLSKDKNTIEVRNRIFPTSKAKKYQYKDGWYQLVKEN